MSIYGAEFAALVRKTYDDFGRAIREGNIKAEYANHSRADTFRFPNATVAMAAPSQVETIGCTV